MSQSRVSILTLSKSRSQQSRKSWQFQKACLDNRVVLIKIEISQICLDTTFQSQKSWSRSRNLSREIFGKPWQFVLISIESWLILSFVSIKISQIVKIFEHEVPQKVSRYLDKSWKISTNLKNLSTVLIYLDNLDDNLDAA